MARISNLPLSQTILLSHDPAGFLAHRAAASADCSFSIRPWPLPEITVFTVPAAIEHLLVEANGFAAGKATQAVLPILGARSLLALDGDEHRERRRTLTPLFGHAGVESHHEMIHVATVSELAAWPRGETLQTLPRLRELAFAIACRVILGELTNDAVAVLSRAVADLLRARSALTSWFPPPVSRPYETRRRILDRLLADRAVEQPTGDSALARLLEHGLHGDELLEELRALLIVGHETTACAGAWALELLAWNPAVQAELRSGGNSEFDAAVASEVLRARPPVVDVVRQATGATIVAGCPVAAGSIVAASPLVAHHDRDVWVDPEIFDPSRFIDRAPPRASYIPFGGGERRCLGAQLALLELRELIASAASIGVRPALDRPARSRLAGTAVAPAGGGQIALI